MRVTSDLYVSALMRRVFAEGGYAAIVRKGMQEAGAIFIVIRARNGDMALYGPAPQADYADARPDERLFARIATNGGDEELQAKLGRESRFDPDMWIVEIETAAPPDTLFPISRP
jgi:hypothetical protein